MRSLPPAQIVAVVAPLMRQIDALDETDYDATDAEEQLQREVEAASRRRAIADGLVAASEAAEAEVMRAMTRQVEWRDRKIEALREQVSELKKHLSEAIDHAQSAEKAAITRLTSTPISRR